MSKRETELFIFDVFVAILKIEEASSHFDNADDLKHDYLSWDSVVREFEIIGEASKYLINDAILDNEKKRIVDFRNVLIHHYFGIDEDAVWRVIKKELPGLKVMIHQHIARLPSELKNELLQDFMEENIHLDFVVEALERLK
jgi:uncharacterized protein with HEPN domain